MKATILSGLVALAFGAFTTSCSNILEENSVLNSAAQSGMGELRINLTTDPTVEVFTKAAEDLSNFKVSIGDKEYTDWNGKALTVPVGENQTVNAYNMKETEVLPFAWNAPYYTGSQTANIVAGQTASVTITCKRANSTLAIDTTGFNPKEGKDKILCVQSLMAFNGEDTQTGFDLLKKDGNPADKTDSVCVKAGIVAKIVLTPAKMDGTVLTPVIRYLNKDNSNTSGNTDAAQKYNVSYQVNTKNGQASITITVNGKVKDFPIYVDVNPYESNTNSGS